MQRRVELMSLADPSQQSYPLYGVVPKKYLNHAKDTIILVYLKSRADILIFIGILSPER
jgi:hypothetical protein